jgi:hypothetical protein
MIAFTMDIDTEGATLAAGRDIPMTGRMRIYITDKENFPVV